jgi:hypothetical protein
MVSDEVCVIDVGMFFSTRHRPNNFTCIIGGIYVTI